APPRPMAVRQPLLVPLPQVLPATPIVEVSNPAGTTPPHGVDGTWRQEGSFLILDLNGQQLRLANTNLQTPTRVEDNAGEVYGQLSHRGRPLIGCEVVLMPLRKTWASYTAANRGEAKLFTTTTNATGVYHFASVLPGSYKLKWRPAGEESWIRRAENRPDVHVRSNETATIKEIRVALRTIN
ncbi:MAG: carboxypeptidase-like regulatory domain-containing protein, partial [Acidimicrobiales bacterium]